VATKLAHPNIVEVVEVGYDARLGVPFIVMELLDGQTLGRVLALEGAMRVERAVRVIRQVLSALSAVHAIGVVHRDLKPPNVVLVESDRVKLVDFGVAHLAETDGYTKLTRTGQVVGTPSFMSPEQAAGREIDARADVWAAGALLYSCALGTWPFAGRPWVDVLPRDGRCPRDARRGGRHRRRMGSARSARRAAPRGALRQHRAR
jgi:serine/threonine-protein kinase